LRPATERANPMQLFPKLTNYFLSLIFLLGTAVSQAQSATLSDPLFQQFGGKAGIDKIVADFLPILLADDRIKDTFKDADMERLGNLLAEQFCQLTGGPCEYSGKNMREAHKDMHLSNAQFNALAEDLQFAMEKNGVSSSAQNKLIAKLAPMQRTVVTR
jgi:hemoglobin